MGRNIRGVGRMGITRYNPRVEEGIIFFDPSDNGRWVRDQDVKLLEDKLSEMQLFYDAVLDLMDKKSN